MVRFEMKKRSSGTPASAPKAFKWVVRSAIALSLIANVGLIAKMAVFDSGIPFRPVCFSRPHGLVVMSGLMRKRFKERILLNLTYAKTLAKDGTIYISRWVWWRDKEGIWNLSRQIAERLHRERTGTPRPPSGMYPGAHTCRFISTYAIE
jgi:hypothetical protein